MERIVRITISNGTVLFVFIAGYLFQHLASRFNYKKYLKTKFKNVITPYIVVSIPAILIFTVFLKRETVWDGFYNDPVWLQVLYFYITGLHLAPFWFIPVITIFYLVSPMLVLIDKAKIFYFLLPLFIWLSCLIGRGEGAPFISFVHFFSIYATGMFFSHYKSAFNIWLGKTPIIFCAVSAVSFLWLYELYFLQINYTYINVLQKLILCVAILGILIRLGEKATHHYLNLVADASFGVFFVHSYVLTAGKLSTQRLLGDLPQGSVWLYLLVTFSTLLICMAVVYSIKALTGSKSRLLVGS